MSGDERCESRGARETRCRVTGRKGMRRRFAHEWMIDRPRAVDGELDRIRGGGGREVSDQDQRKRDRAPQKPHSQHRQDQPDEPVTPEVRKRDEDGVEGLGAVIDNPALKPLVNRDQNRRRRGLPRRSPTTTEAAFPWQPTNASPNARAPSASEAKRGTSRAQIGRI